MSTRGLVVVRSNGEIKVAQYNHCDSYISWLGTHIQDFIANLNTDDELFNKFKVNVDNSIFCETSDDSNAEETLNDLLQRPVSTENYYDFIEDHLFCEYAYIIDLNSRILEVHKNGRIFSKTFSELSEINFEKEFTEWYNK